MKILEDLGIIVTEDFEDGRRVNGKIPMVLSKPCKYTPQDLDRFDGACKINNVFLNNNEVLVIALDFSCSIIVSGFSDNPTGIVLHGDEDDLIKLLSGLNGQLCFEDIRLQRIERASNRAVLNIYREAFKTAESFLIMDKKGTLHVTTIIMDLDKISYSTDTGVCVDGFFRLLHSDIDVVKVDRVSTLCFDGHGTLALGSSNFYLDGVSRITRGMLKSRKTYALSHNGVGIGDLVIFGRSAHKQIYIELKVPVVFDEDELSQFKNTLQRYILPNINGWVIILNYTVEEKMVDVIEETPVTLDVAESTEATDVEMMELVLGDEDKPFYYNFTDAVIASKDMTIVGYDGESLHERLLMGAIIDFKSPVATIRIIGDLIMAGVDRIYYHNGVSLERYNTEGHVDSAEDLIDDLKGRRHRGRDYGDLSRRGRR